MSAAKCLYAFIVNPISGAKDKTGIVEKIREEFDNCEILFTRYQGHARSLAAATDADVVVAVGGDGTVNEVACGLIDTGKALGMSRNPRKAIRQLKGAYQVINTEYQASSRH